MFKWLGKREPDYPQVLEQLDAKIRKTHLSLSNLQAKQRRVMFKALVYPGLVYLVGVVAYLAAPAASTSIGAAIRRALPLVVVPFAIYSFRVALGLWFSRCRNALVTDLAQMEQLQQNTVEELKQKTAYYQTKGLIERYDSPQRAAPHSVNGNIINPATETISKIPLTPKRQPLLARLSVESPIISAKPSPKSSSLQLQIPLQSPISLPSMHSENSQLLSPIPPTLEAPVISTWMDRLMDALLGPQESSHAKYALICESCFAHNGLSLPHEYMNASTAILT